VQSLPIEVRTIVVNDKKKPVTANSSTTVSGLAELLSTLLVQLMPADKTKVWVQSPGGSDNPNCYKAGFK